MSLFDAICYCLLGALIMIVGETAFTAVRQRVLDAPKAEVCRANDNVWLSKQRACVKRVDN